MSNLPKSFGIEEVRKFVIWGIGIAFAVAIIYWVRTSWEGWWNSSPKAATYQVGKPEAPSIDKPQPITIHEGVWVRLKTPDGPRKNIRFRRNEPNLYIIHRYGVYGKEPTSVVIPARNNKAFKPIIIGAAEYGIHADYDEFMIYEHADNPLPLDGRMAVWYE